MKQITKNTLITAIAVLVCFGILTFSCSAKGKNANTAFAESSKNASATPAVQIPSQALSVVEAMQTVFRSVADGVLPSVVEIDVTETKQRTTSSIFDGFPFFFFGEEGNNGSKTQEYTQEGLGSGVIVRKSGKTYYVLTNNHVVGSATTISVKLYSGKVYDGKLVGTDARKDVALVSFESDDGNIPVAKLGDSDKVLPGDICFAMGTPLGYYSSVTQGIVSATGRSGSGVGNISDFIQTDAAINQGNSGGPLINIYGEVIGINTWIASQSGGSQGLGFSIPINNIKRSIDDFISGGKVTYGWMGVSLIEIEEIYKEALGIKGEEGVFVANVHTGSPAAKAGIEPGDFITALNGKAMKSADQLSRDVGDIPVGKNANFEILRSGKKITLSAKIEERTDEVVADNSKLWPGFIAGPLTDDIRKALKLENKVKGALVANVASKSPAAVLGLRNGDIITAVNGKSIKEVAEFYSALANAGRKEVWFDVYREGHVISTVKYKF